MASGVASPLIIKCDPEVLGERYWTLILRVRISRMLKQSGEVQVIADEDFKTGRRQVANPANRSWTFVTYGRDVRGKPATGQNAADKKGISWEIHDPKCADSGVYQCTLIASVHWDKSITLQTYSGQQMINSRDMRNIKITVTPFRLYNIFSRSDSVTLMCTVDAYHKVVFTWSSRRSDVREFEVETEGVSNAFWVRDSPNSSESDCRSQRYITSLTIQVAQREAGNYAFRCTAKYIGATDDYSAYSWLNFGNVTRKYLYQGRFIIAFSSSFVQSSL
ncbi:hypothetical protein ElyMa_001495300 [Elysia marginata]|uniref:Ig-like domain-containing protein n=1 Tax=Elysia marginata TaxID=1093978 RepID=A0AAV4J8P9_9GAST|nr:hypothetical protein ElyMa_001495300 [Elysia marginata]